MVSCIPIICLHLHDKFCLSLHNKTYPYRLQFGIDQICSR